MAKDRTNQGGPTQSSKDTPTADRDYEKVQGREELQERTAAGHHPGEGRRNGSEKQR